MGALEVFSLPDERFDSIVQCEPAYSVKLDSLSEVAVTPDAYEYFGYKALAKTVSGRLSAPGQYSSAREPYTRITIAAPHEVSEEALDDKVVYARSISGECQFVVAHHQTPDKYKEAGIAVLGSLVRSNNPLDKRSDRRILADMGKKMKKSYLGELDSG